MKIYSWVIALILTIACMYLIHSNGQAAKRVNTLTSQVAEVNSKCEALSIDLHKYTTQKEFTAYQVEVAEEFKAQQWQYEEYKGLDEVLTAWFGKQQAAVVGRGK